jgi:membrane protease YdiL (CAAX protease family)
MTAIVSGTAGLWDFRSRLLAWRVAPRWYAAALLTAPLVLLATLMLLAQFSPGFFPGILGDSADPAGPVRTGSRAAFVMMGLLVGVGAGFFEELGWTGFALPRIRERHQVLAAGLMVGIPWGAWHLLAVYWGSADAFGDIPIPLFMLVSLFSFLPPYRVLMARVYDRTGSLLIAVLMHASLTSSMLILGPIGVTGGAAVTYNFVFAAALWLVVAGTRKV